MRVAQNGTFSYVNFVSGGASAYVSFSGVFGEYPEEVYVLYRNETETVPFLCQVDPKETTNTTVLCLIASPEPGFYFFQVEVYGQYSNVGIDHLHVTDPPEISMVSGCSDDGTGTLDCFTAGGYTITMIGSSFGEGMVCVVYYFL